MCHNVSENATYSSGRFEPDALCCATIARIKPRRTVDVVVWNASRQLRDALLCHAVESRLGERTKAREKTRDKSEEGVRVV